MALLPPCPSASGELLDFLLPQGGHPQPCSAQGEAPHSSRSTYLGVEGSFQVCHVLSWRKAEYTAEAGVEKPFLHLALHMKLRFTARRERHLSALGAGRGPYRPRRSETPCEVGEHARRHLLPAGH